MILSELGVKWYVQIVALSNSSLIMEEKRLQFEDYGRILYRFLFYVIMVMGSHPY
jgi:hypothetical protein